MLEKISLSAPVRNSNYKNSNFQNVSSVTSPNHQNNIQKQDISKLINAYKGYNNIKTASSISFGSSFADAFDDLSKSMVTCRDEKAGKDGEVVGSRVDVSSLTSKFIEDLKKYDDAIKTTITVSKNKDKDTGIMYITDARTQIKKGSGDKMKFEMTVRPPRKSDAKPEVTDNIKQNILIQLEPYRIELSDDHTRHMVGTPETAYVLNTKGNLMAVIEDGENVLLTDTGTLIKKDASLGALEVHASKLDDSGKENKFDEYSYMIPKVFEVSQKTGGSQGGGTELVIGLEKGRFVPEIIESIEVFQDKIRNGEIVLDEFVPAPNAQNVQIAMLAGGFGSRAEYANASSSKIMHGKEDGSNLTKGCFRTATGLTPMETSFISLHKAGYLDCSKENFGIGKNVKFYLNDSGQNRGNGGFSVDLYNVMERDNRKSLLILPNDAMSRIPEALKKLNTIINSGNAAMVMIAKQVKAEDALGKLGIMKISPEGLIDEFDEKPKKFKPGYVEVVDKKEKCYANTFQFAVSKEAFDVLNMLEPYFAKYDGGKKEARDWSKTYTPVLMAITQNDNLSDMNDQIYNKTGIIIPEDKLLEAKNMLGNQKIYAIKSDEPWADCGTLNALYHTTCEIARGEFPLEDFERARVLACVDAKTGLVTSNPEQKAEIEAKYDVDGQVMVVPKAKPADPDVVERNEFAITRYSSKH